MLRSFPFALLFIGLSALTACNSEAEPVDTVDPAGYYTKAEVDAKFAALATNQTPSNLAGYYTKEEVDARVAAAVAVATSNVRAEMATNGYVPAGLIAAWSGSPANVPAGWTLCDGTLGTPDLRDRFVVGAGAEYSVGATGGEKTHLLSAAEMPSHSHTFDDVYLSESGGPWGNQGWRGLSGNDFDNGPHFYSHSTATTGGGTAHENRPPFYALAFIMRF